MRGLPLPSVLLTKPAARAVQSDEIRAFYDQHIVEKVADFVDGNPRVEAAWETVQRWAPPAPGAILEVGCGFGQISWRLATQWPAAEVTGFDISPRSLDLAARVFQRPNLKYSGGSLDGLERPSGYDLIALVDVYEHIAVADRAAFHASLDRLLAPMGRLVLTFPTPAHQHLLRTSHPDRLQPVDEDIELTTLQHLAGATNTRLLMFSERSIWRSGDYAHAALGREAAGSEVRRVMPPASSVGDRVRGKLRSLLRREDPHSREARLRLVECRLGSGIYRPR